MSGDQKLSCSKCSSMWQKEGRTNCWSDPQDRPPRPSYCPSEKYSEEIDTAFKTYLGDDEDAKLARVAAKVEGLCYLPVPGSDAVNARWTRVEDTIALA